MQKPDIRLSAWWSYPFPSWHSVAGACWLADWLLRLEKELPAAAHVLRIKREDHFGAHNLG